MKAVASLLIVALPALAQCPPGGCHPGWTVPVVVPAYPPPIVRVADRPPPAQPRPAPRAGVCECDTCPGGDACKCGCRRAAPVNPPVNFGVDRSKLCPEERYTLGGREASRAAAMNAIEAAGDIPNDSALPRLTVIGSDAARKAVLDDLKAHPSLAWLKDRVVAKGYPPDHWRVKDGGFVTPKGADAVVYVQKPDGTVLWRQDEYAGPERLAGALRDKVPGYDPSKDPQPQPTPPAPAPGPTPGPGLKLNPWWLATAAVALFVFLRRRA